MMKVELRKEIEKLVTNLAEDLGLSEEEVVHQILEWYFTDNPD